MMWLTPEAVEILTSKVCREWPRCNCYSTLANWGKQLGDEETVWELDYLEAVEDLVFISLCCVQKRCPDKTIKEYAKRQLRKTFWDRQKAKSIMEH
jgi:hypothetical protein